MCVNLCEFSQIVFLCRLRKRTLRVRLRPSVVLISWYQMEVLAQMKKPWFSWRNRVPMNWKRVNMVLDRQTGTQVLICRLQKQCLNLMITGSWSLVNWARVKQPWCRSTILHQVFIAGSVTLVVRLQTQLPEFLTCRPTEVIPLITLRASTAVYTLHSRLAMYLTRPVMAILRTKWKTMVSSWSGNLSQMWWIALRPRFDSWRNPHLFLNPILIFYSWQEVPIHVQ